MTTIEEQLTHRSATEVDGLEVYKLAQVPEFHGGVFCCSREIVAVLRERHGRDSTLVALEVVDI